MLGSGILNSVKECRHLKPPLWKDKALRMSYKTYAMGDVQRALSEQNTVELRLSKAFSGSKEMEDPVPQLSGRGALDAAKRKQVHQQASLKSEDQYCRFLEELIFIPMVQFSASARLKYEIYAKTM